MGNDPPGLLHSCSAPRLRSVLGNDADPRHHAGILVREIVAVVDELADEIRVAEVHAQRHAPGINVPNDPLANAPYGTWTVSSIWCRPYSMPWALSTKKWI